MTRSSQPGPERCCKRVNVNGRMSLLQYSLQYPKITGRVSRVIEAGDPFHRVSELGFEIPVPHWGMTLRPLRRPELPSHFSTALIVTSPSRAPMLSAGSWIEGH